MTQEEFNNLEVGDIIQNEGSGQAYQVDKKHKDMFGIIWYDTIRVVTATNASEWHKTPYRFTMREPTP